MLCTSYGVFFVDFVNISCIFIILKSNYFAVYFRYADVFLLKNKPHMGFGLRNNSATIRINKPQKAHNRHCFRLCAFLFLQGCFLQSIEVCKSFTAHKVINSKPVLAATCNSHIFCFFELPQLLTLSLFQLLSILTKPLPFIAPAVVTIIKAFGSTFLIPEVIL